MNAGFRLFIAVALLSATPAFAEKPAGPMPSVRLRHLIDTTLGKIGIITNPKQVINRAPLTTAQAEFAAAVQTAPPEKQPVYQAALKVVADLTAAVEEHDKAVANFTYSKNLHGPQDTKDEENSRRGYAANAKQNKENADSRKELLDKEQLFVNGATATWNQRVAQLREFVEQAYTSELVAEKQMAMTASTAPRPAPKPAPNPVPSASTPSDHPSPAGSWTPDNTGQRPLSLKEDNTVAGGKFTGSWKWTDRSKGALSVTWDDGLGMDLNLSTDGRTLSGKNSHGRALSYSRGN